MGQSTTSRRFQIVRLVVSLYVIFKRVQRLEARGGKSDQVDALYRAAGTRIREAAGTLAGAIVKAGQFLSLRQELFPEAFTRELQALQDAVPPAPYRAIQTVVEEAYKRPLGEVFRDFAPDPIASASLAQVHRATLTDGQTVAVKVLRPGIARLTEVDLATLGRVAWVTRRIPGLRTRLDFMALHQEFADTLAEELDMRAEAEHLNRFQEQVEPNDRIVTPRVYATYTTASVLVMTYLTGANVGDAAQLRMWHVDAGEVRDTLLKVYLRQILQTGFVHLDPHPGNLLVQPDGKVVLLDFGMVAEYSEAERSTFRRLIESVFLRNALGVAESLQNLGYLSEGVNPAEWMRDFGPITGLNGDFLRRLRAEPTFQLPARYMLLLRCVGLLKSVLTALTPDETDWIGVMSEIALPITMDAVGNSVARA